MLENIKNARKKHPNLVSGFDLVNEEEFTKPIAFYMPEILAAQEDLDPVIRDMPTFFHAGETNKKDLFNMHDAVLLNSKRIGHGFQLSLFPNLLKEIIERDICVEACPLSNKVLGYTLDLKIHPIRWMLYHGLQITISPDD